MCVVFCLHLVKVTDYFLPSATVVMFHKRLSFCPKEGGVRGRGVCVAGGTHGRGVCVAEGECMVGKMVTAADGTHPTGMHSC